jgi:predicted N-acetyltransferase YhbS
MLSAFPADAGYSKKDQGIRTMNIETKPSLSVSFRLATDADRARLIPLINSAFSIETFLEGDRTDEESLAAMMRKGAILAAEDGEGRLVGCVYMEVRGSERGYMGMLTVDPARQRSGLGTRIMEAAEEHLRGQGCKAVDILVLNLRPELPPIYRRHGYVESGTQKDGLHRTLKPGFEYHFIIMSKDL